MSSKTFREAMRAARAKAIAEHKTHANRIITFDEKLQGYRWPQEIWKTKGSFKRAVYYANELTSGNYLKSKRHVDTFIGCLINDLYWDCYEELAANGLIKKSKTKSK